MDFGKLPPEINSGRMYSGLGAGSMMDAATAWDGLAARLNQMAAGYRAATTAPARRRRGSAAVVMAQTATAYIDWLNAAAAQARQTAVAAKAVADAYDSALAAMAPPQLIEANRVQRKSLAATNYLGQTS